MSAGSDIPGRPARRKRRPFKLAAPTIREHPLQEQIARLLTIEIAPPGHASGRGVLWFSVDHAHYAGVPGTRTRRGIIAGVPDLYLQHEGRAHWIELKTATGRLSRTQREVGDEIARIGGRVAVARSAEDVLAFLDAWNIPRHNRTRFAA